MNYRNLDLGTSVKIRWSNLSCHPKQIFTFPRSCYLSSAKKFIYLRKFELGNFKNMQPVHKGCHNGDLITFTMREVLGNKEEWNSVTGIKGITVCHGKNIQLTILQLYYR